MNIKLDNGKYEFIVNNNGTMKCLRHGEEWRDLTGDGMVLAMAYEIERLRDELVLAEEKSESIGGRF